MIRTTTRSRLLTGVPLAIVAAALAACSGGGTGQAAAQGACKAYANVNRHQVTTTAAQADAVVATARADADRAATADPAWAGLQRDITYVFSRRGEFDTATAAEMDAYFAADRRVQADCVSAGEDIGPLRP
ncbi:hypothetical protein GALL_364410 [mine drainage metagenome]|uniref:Lipoprotein n=1 Tax=mine drainage metagenome TaxID=410659 RepID=A0A1J5QPH1_9ZZZZ